MELERKLSQRIGRREIDEICRACSGASGNSMNVALYSLIGHTDERIAYNSLWVFTHLRREELCRLEPHRNELIDLLMATSHSGRQRLLLTILDHLSYLPEYYRTDYFDYCMERINSTEPCSIRSLCIKQAYTQSKYYPALQQELKAELELMEQGELSPGLKSIKKNILKKIGS